MEGKSAADVQVVVAEEQGGGVGGGEEAGEEEDEARLVGQGAAVEGSGGHGGMRGWCFIQPAAAILHTEWHTNPYLTLHSVCKLFNCRLSY